MPRNPGTGIYTKPYPDVISDTTIESTVHNGEIADIETDLNTPRPIVAGGTGANSAVQARDNLDAEVAMQRVTNFDSHPWEPGSFVALNGVTGSPNPASVFMGTFIGNAPIGQGIVLAYDISNVSTPHPLYVRQLISGVWQSWHFVGSDQVDVAGDTMTGNLTISKQAPALILNKTDNAGPCLIQGTYGGLRRWEVAIGSTAAESNPAVGSDFNIAAYDNAGAFRSTALSISRNTGYATFTGDVIINKPVPELSLEKTTSGGNSTIVGKTGANARWRIDLGTTAAESGSNAGSDFAVGRYNDGGFIMDVPLAIQRSTGISTLLAARFNPAGGTLPALGGVISVGSPTGIVGISIRPTDATTWAVNFENNAGTQVGTISTTTTATGYNTSSDERLKEDLKSFDAGNIIDDTNVYDFAWKSTGERSFGILAQQAIEVYPNAVNYNKAEDAWGIDYSKYVPVILQELKALRARVAELEAKLTQ